MLVPDAYVKRQVTTMIKTVTNIFEISPTHFVPNIRQQHQHTLLNFFNLYVGKSK